MLNIYFSIKKIFARRVTWRHFHILLIFSFLYRSTAHEPSDLESKISLMEKYKRVVQPQSCGELEANFNVFVVSLDTKSVA